ASDKLGGLCDRLGYATEKESEDFLKALEEKSPHKEMQGKACMAQAQFHKYLIKLSQQLKDNPRMVVPYEGRLGKDTVKRALELDPTKETKEVEKLLERVVTKYGDVKVGRNNTLGAMATMDLEAVRNPIAEGKPAPDIIGEDQDGKNFK